MQTYSALPVIDAAGNEQEIAIQGLAPYLVTYTT